MFYRAMSTSINAAIFYTALHNESFIAYNICFKQYYKQMNHMRDYYYFPLMRESEKSRSVRENVLRIHVAVINGTYFGQSREIGRKEERGRKIINFLKYTMTSFTLVCGSPMHDSVCFLMSRAGQCIIHARIAL